MDHVLCLTWKIQGYVNIKLMLEYNIKWSIPVVESMRRSIIRLKGKRKIGTMGK